MGTYPNADRECMNSGGHVEERGGGGCGSTQSARPLSGSFEAPEDDGADGYGPAGEVVREESPLAEAAVGPIRALRDRLPDSAVLRDLATINYSPAVLRLLEEDPELHAQAGDVVGMASQLSLLALVDPESPTLAMATYGEDLHRWVVGMADGVAQRTDDEEVRAALQRLVDFLQERVGQPVGELVAALRAVDSTAT
ncbi:MAG: hypothetical protein U0Q15_15725 [Kineosporiaceae bacterium]